MRQLLVPLVLLAWVFAPLAAQQRFAIRATQVLPSIPEGIRSVAVADFDGDGIDELVVGLERPDPSGQVLRLFDRTQTDRYVDLTATHLPPPGPLGNQTYTEVSSGDLDGDGDVDLLVLRFFDPSSVLLNDGTGHFVDAGPGRLPVFPLGRDDGFLADVDGDSDLDLIVNDFGGVVLAANDGSGRFGPIVRVSSPAPAQAFDAADVDADGHIDLIGIGTYDLFRDGRGVWFQDANGTFTFQSIVDSGPDPDDAAAVDLDGDGDLDLVYAIGESDSREADHEVFWNDGNRNFRLAHGLPGGQDPADTVAAVDLDADGNPELVFGSRLGPVHVWWNSGSAFSERLPAVLPPQVVRCRDLVAFDAEGDGDQDLCIVGEESLRIVFNSGGTLVDSRGADFDEASCGFHVRFLDVDGDGDLDWTATAEFFLVVRRNLDTLGFGPPEAAWLDPGRRTFSTLAWSDLDGDGDLDAWLTLSDGKIRILVNDGSGVFSEESSARLPAGFDRVPATAVRLADLDGDTDDDIAIGTGWGAPYSILRNDGSGHFTLDPFDWPAGGNALDLEVGDIDADGDLDLLVIALPASGPGHLERYLNDGSGRFRLVTGTPSLDAPGLGERFRLADVDGDGSLDILSQSLWLYPNDGAGGYPVGSQVARPSSSFAEPELADLDGDGDLDLVLGDAPRPSTALENDGSGRFADVTTRWLGARPAAFRTPIATDIDGDADTDILGVDFYYPARALRNRGNDLDVVLPARLGSVLELELTRTGGQLAAFVYGFTLLPAPLVLPIGTLRIDPATSPVSDLQPMVGDRATSRLALPLVPNAAGVSLYAQGLSSDASGGYRLTNLVRAVAFH